MADVYGRLTGKAGVCFSTLGPGATHICIPEDVAREQVPEGVASRLLKRPASCKEWAEEEVLEQADLVIAVGYDIVELAPVKWNWDGNRRILHIDSRPAHVNKLYQPDTEVAGGRFISGKAPEAFI